MDKKPRFVVALDFICNAIKNNKEINCINYQTEQFALQVSARDNKVAKTISFLKEETEDNEE